MDDFKEMGLLYEAFAKSGNPYVGTSRDTSRAYPGSQPQNPNHSLRTIPLKDPGGSGRVFDGGQGGQGITAPISDEETDMSALMRGDILKKVETLMHDAESFDDTKTMIALNELKEFIERL